MGREMRRVPPNWVHPKNEYGHDQAMHDQTFEQAAAEWKAGLAAWEAGERPEYCSTPEVEYWEYEGTPPENREFYRPWKDEEATWFQIWQTVSEGSPTTPPFATPEELIEHLVTVGEDQDNGRTWSREAATRIVGGGWAPSGIIVPGAGWLRPGDKIPGLDQ